MAATAAAAGKRAAHAAAGWDDDSSAQEAVAQQWLGKLQMVALSCALILAALLGGLLVACRIGPIGFLIGRAWDRWVPQSTGWVPYQRRDHGDEGMQRANLHFGLEGDLARCSFDAASSPSASWPRLGFRRSGLDKRYWNKGYVAFPCACLLGPRAASNVTS